MWPRPAFALKGARRRVPHCGPQLPETGVVCMGQRPAARCPRVASSAPWVPVRIPVATGFFSCRPDPVVRLHPQGTRGGLPHLPGPLLPRELGRPAPFSNPCLFMDMGTFYPSRKREVAPSRVCLSVRPGCALSKHVDSPLTPWPSGSSTGPPSRPPQGRRWPGNPRPPTVALLAIPVLAPTAPRLHDPPHRLFPKLLSRARV